MKEKMCCSKGMKRLWARPWRPGEGNVVGFGCQRTGPGPRPVPCTFPSNGDPRIRVRGNEAWHRSDLSSVALHASLVAIDKILTP